MAVIPHPVIVPHPVVIPSSGGGGGGDLPTSWAVAYCAVGILVWIAAAVAFTLHERVTPYTTLGEVIGFGIMIGACAAMVWPFSLAAGALWLGIRKVLSAH